MLFNIGGKYWEKCWKRFNEEKLKITCQLKRDVLVAACQHKSKVLAFARQRKRKAYRSQLINIKRKCWLLRVNFEMGKFVTA